MDQSEAQVTIDDMAEDEVGDEAEMPEADAPLEPPARLSLHRMPTRIIWSIHNEHDEEVMAEDLAEPAELERLRAYLDQQLEPLKGAVSASGQQAAAPVAGATEPVVAV